MLYGMSVATFTRFPLRDWIRMRPPTRRKTAVIVMLTDYLMEHPGAAHLREDGLTYSDDFRRYVVGLTRPGGPAAKMTLAEFADASHLPQDLLQEWLSRR